MGARDKTNANGNEMRLWLTVVQIKRTIITLKINNTEAKSTVLQNKLLFCPLFVYMNTEHSEPSFQGRLFFHSNKILLLLLFYQWSFSSKCYHMNSGTYISTHLGWDDSEATGTEREKTKVIKYYLGCTISYCWNVLYFWVDLFYTFRHIYAVMEN